MRQSGADRRARQCRERRLAHRYQRAGQQALAFLQVGDLLVIGHVQLLLVAVRAHALDVAAGAERGAGAGDQQRADVGVLAAGLDHAAQRRRQRVRQRIADFRPVQRDDGDAVADHAQEFIGAGVDGDVGGHVSPNCFVLCRHCGSGCAKQSRPVVCGSIARIAAMCCAIDASLRPPYDGVKTSPPTAAIPAPRSRRCAAVAARSSSSRQWRRDRASNPAGRRASVRTALRMPPSMTKCAMWMPCGDSSRAMLCASPRSANLPIANGADCG